MHVVPSDASPFLFLWYIFLVFFGIVLAFQLLMLVLRALLGWRLRVLTKKYDSRQD